MLQQRMHKLDTIDGCDVLSEAPRSKPRLRNLNPAPATPSNFSSGHGRVYRKPVSPPRSIDLLIPPRQGPGLCPATHSIWEWADAHVVSIAFPVPVRVAEVAWELHGDVLEVEYLGRAFTYYHAFLVPAGAQPTLEQEERTLTFCFLRSAQH